MLFPKYLMSGLCCGNVSISGHVLSVGVDKTLKSKFVSGVLISNQFLTNLYLKMQRSTATLSYPGNKTSLVAISAKMQPIDHKSTGKE